MTPVYKNRPDEASRCYARCVSVGFVYPYDPNKPDQRRASALHPPTNTCAGGRVGWGRRRDQRRLDARIKGYEDLLRTSRYSAGDGVFHKPGSLTK